MLVSMFQSALSDCVKLITHRLFLFLYIENEIKTRLGSLELLSVIRFDSLLPLRG